MFSNLHIIVIIDNNNKIQNIKKRHYSTTCYYYYHHLYYYYYYYYYHYCSTLIYRFASLMAYSFSLFNAAYSSNSFLSLVSDLSHDALV